MNNETVNKDPDSCGKISENGANSALKGNITSDDRSTEWSSEVTSEVTNETTDKSSDLCTDQSSDFTVSQCSKVDKMHILIEPYVDLRTAEDLGIPQSIEELNKAVFERTCDICTKKKTIDSILEGVREVFSTNDPKLIDTILKRTERDRYVLSVKNRSDKTLLITIHKMISNISSGGESPGIHFGIFTVHDQDTTDVDVSTIEKSLDTNDRNDINDTTDTCVNKYGLCAIKVLLQGGGVNEQSIVKSFKNCGLNKDDRIVKNITIFESDHRTYVVNEFIDGHSLDDVLLEHKELLTGALIREIVHSAYLGLRRLHKNGYLHLDIKPGNIMIFNSQLFKTDTDTTYDLKRSDFVKIIDFGKSMKFNSNKKERELNTDINNLKPQFIKNVFSTPAYVSPNVIVGEEHENISSEEELFRFGILCDLWSFGMTIYELYTGLAYYDKDKSGKIGKIITSMMKDFKRKTDMDVAKLIEQKEEYQIDDATLSAVKLCLIYRSFNSNTVEQCIKIEEELDKIFGLMC
ncbi:serine/threonine protein kinase [Yasminevirus sp. GU-2018]|uniref:Serine/threonine protein kinase n=1 Tax=Yasminevirus sp. GU-2018 TaxID=2420051 RepID=A0A5K0UAY4_9VIRU|nr:serine/threonine protein kinase [Yasminevirus sp. GU-2018]